MRVRDFFSERILFGALVIGGYYVLVILGVHAAKGSLSPEAMSIIHDAMLTAGPLVGIIVNAIWKSDKTDKDQASTIASLANTVAAANTPLSPPSPQTPPEAPE